MLISKKTIHIFLITLFVGCLFCSEVGAGTTTDLSIGNATAAIKLIPDIGNVKIYSGVLQEGNKAYVWYAKIGEGNYLQIAVFHRYNDGRWVLYNSESTNYFPNPKRFYFIPAK
jgi:hypothetical protein